MTKNEHVYVIFLRPEIADDVISRENVKTIEGYIVLNFEAAGVKSFWKKSKSAICVMRRQRQPT